MRKYISGLLAVVLAIGSAAFTADKAPSGKKATLFYWRAGTGNQFAAASYTSVSSSTYAGIACSSGGFVCKFTSDVAIPLGGLIDTNNDNVPDALNNAQQTPISPLLKGN